MGLILDSSVVIGAKRGGVPVAGLLSRIVAVTGDQRAALSAAGLTELVHAIWRARDVDVRARREAFIASLLAEMEVVPYTGRTAFLAGRIGGEQSARGFTIPSVDLMIGATALEHGYAVVTSDSRHFHLIPGLEVVEL